MENYLKAKKYRANMSDAKGLKQGRSQQRVKTAKIEFRIQTE